MRRLALLVSTLLLAAGPASADIIDFTVDLDAAQSLATGEATPGSTGSGTGTLQLDTDTGIVSYDISWGGTQGAEIFAHLHGPAAPGATNPARYFLDNGGSSGSYNASVMLTDPVEIGPAAYPIQDQIDDLIAGLWYVNVHTTHSVGGEIRGQILALPEPGVIALAALGLVALARRRA